MNEIDKLKKMLVDRNLRAVARGAGVHPNCLYRLQKGAKNLRYDTIRRVLDYLENQAKAAE